MTELGESTPSTDEQLTFVKTIIDEAIKFGNELIIEFAAENVVLGITQAGMTTAVRSAAAQVINALQTGSLYDAIQECRAIPSESKDSIFVTDARLLQFINKIESKLGITLSTEL
jgi:hypothetical protein